MPGTASARGVHSASRFGTRHNWSLNRTAFGGPVSSNVIWQKARPHNAATIAVQSNALKSWKPVENVRHPLWAPTVLDGLRP